MSRSPLLLYSVLFGWNRGPRLKAAIEEKAMKSIVTISVCILMISLLASCGNEAEKSATGTDAESTVHKTACDFLTKEDVEAITGIPVTNVAPRNRGTYSSCSYEAEDWRDTTGVSYYPSLDPVGSSAALAEFLGKDIEKDQAPYQTPEPVEGLGDAAAHYVDTDGTIHYIAVQKGNSRIVINAKSKEAVLSLARKALESMQ